MSHAPFVEGIKKGGELWHRHLGFSEARVSGYAGQDGTLFIAP